MISAFAHSSWSTPCVWRSCRSPCLYFNFVSSLWTESFLLLQGLSKISVISLIIFSWLDWDGIVLPSWASTIFSGIETSVWTSKEGWGFMSRIALLQNSITNGSLFINVGKAFVLFAFLTPRSSWTSLLSCWIISKCDPRISWRIGFPKECMTRSRESFRKVAHISFLSSEPEFDHFAFIASLFLLFRFTSLLTILCR